MNKRIIYTFIQSENMGINPKNIINILSERFSNYTTDTQVNTDEKTLAKNLIEIVENAVYNKVEFIDDLQIDQVADENECVESDSMKRVRMSTIANLQYL